MSKDLTDLQLLRELEPVAEAPTNRHMSMMKGVEPRAATSHVVIGRQELPHALGGRDWDPGQAEAFRRSPGWPWRGTRSPRTTCLRTTPRESAMNLQPDGPGGYWVNPLDRRGEPARHRHAGLPRAVTRGGVDLRSRRAHGALHDLRLTRPSQTASDRADVSRRAPLARWASQVGRT